MTDRDPLALEEQVCFALAVASREVVASYRSVLEPLGLTHPQYLVMLALWQHDATASAGLSVSELSALLHLDPGTSSPLVKRLEAAGLVSRRRSPRDERVLVVEVTPEGRALRRRALAVPTTMLARLGMSEDDLAATNDVLHRIIDAAHESVTA
ncbi:MULTISPECIES: MarR family winged helix-turn-helix transcriptional regulator [Aeromicrobium]|uniref:MarR family winged helix-turn-helix transcriptional regulator n=1 Tax=Aeromicrobium TaxID=2040 RepID=UPI0006F21EC1|nr:MULTISPECIES: MarR family transcriptional regulator [Aeromicrobium]KQX73816.1 MarR family transcriptional regulator [Aeromicrobium sp. Root472D3]MBD8606902.1 MarR family transcriptional regulator [Aeromicrobium sp. CFBP 8757]MCL8251574.1 MarR family transcriptional regulator [Aeromicrobium fastidiosum]